jgi:DNA repair exonuclease SbcCD ATPase subunit
MNNKDNTLLAEAYQRILENTSKVINKKLARDYYKALKAMRKCEHGSKEYEKFKSQKEDIIKIVNDHGKSVADLDAFLTRKEKEEAAEENISSGVEDGKIAPKICPLCGGDHTQNECPEEGNVP